MNENLYRVRYVYTDYSSLVGHRDTGFQLYDAVNGQDAVDQCREDFGPEAELKILDVCIWSGLGYWMPLLDTAWK